MSNNKSAFTLVELAIVIVIIGLLVGGVLQGEELIKQAKYRRVSADVSGYNAAILTYYGKYSCIPGDCPTSFRFLADKCGTNGAITAGGCNGNGDRILSRAEGRYLWAHLGATNLIKGSYSATATETENLPKPPFEGFIMATYSKGEVQSSDCGFALCDDRELGGMNSNVLLMGQYNMSGLASRRLTTGPFLLPLELFEFDAKFDDGKYFSGAISAAQMTTLNPSGGGTLSSSCGSNLDNSYYMHESTVNGVKIRCPLVFKIDM